MKITDRKYNNNFVECVDDTKARSNVGHKKIRPKELAMLTRTIDK